MLVKQYLILLLSSSSKDSFKNILAITFTNKAVAEMKSRIIEGLNSLAKEEKSIKEESLMQDISSAIGMSPEKVTKKSGEILKSIIHNYAAFEVSTIDGFTHRVLRTFARDLDLPLNFEVELRTEDVLNEAVDRLISKAGEDKELTRVLVKFVLSKTDDDKSWDIAKDLFEIAKLLTQETIQPFLELLKSRNLQDFEELAEALKKQEKKQEQEIVEMADSFFELLSSNGIENGDFSGSYCPKFFIKLQKKNFDVGFSANWQKDLADKPLYAKKLGQDKKDILDDLQAQIFDIFSEAKRKITSIQFLQAVERNLVPLSLLSAIQTQIEEIKKENTVLLISEFNAMIGKAVKDQPAPFIYERLGERYRHYFIDEFQDTSQLQWENLIPLVDHTLSVVHPQEEHGSLTLVGDAKQSIYRWRGGKAEQFMQLCGNQNPFSLETKDVVVLPKNYRSAKTIVDFNNDFFKFSSEFFDHEDHQQLFQESAQEPVSQKQGYVNISFVEAENAEEEMEAYPRRVLEIVKDLERRNVQKSGICILTRKRKESIAVANYLSENAVPVISAESLLLSRSPEVRFINAVLQFCLSPLEKSLKYEILEYLLEHKLELEEEYKFLEQILQLDGQQFFDALKAQAIDFNVGFVNSVSVFEAVEYIIRSFGLGQESNAYLQFFLDFVYETSHSEGSGIFQYLELWERKKNDLSIVVPQGEDAVQIMTIHKAKGLEFPVVIYPFANSQINDTARESFWMNLPEELGSEIKVAYLRAAEKMSDWEGEAPKLYKELSFNSQLDALNVLYVALTRPVQQLYVISRLDLNTKGQENTNKFSGLLISYLKSRGKWNEGLEYHFGNPEELLEQEKKTLNSLQQKTFYSSPTQASGVSIITRSGLMWDSRQKAAIEKGQLVHDLFAQINSVADVEQVLINARESGVVSDKEEQEVRKIISEVVTHPELEEYYSEGVSNLNERDIISESGELLRPDRLNFNGKSISIIDYKTGAENNKHIQQINSYAAVLEAMDFEVEKKLLIYINEGVSVSIV